MQINIGGKQVDISDMVKNNPRLQSAIKFGDEKYEQADECEQANATTNSGGKFNKSCSTDMTDLYNERKSHRKTVC